MSHEQKSACVLCRTKIPTSNEESLAQVMIWVEKEKPWAQVLLASMYLYGNCGLSKSYQRAKELYEMAAEQGEPNARFALGIMYETGQGVDQSIERANEYYETAARQGHGQAMFNIGNAYYNGRGVDLSFTKASAFWKIGAEQGHVNAQGNMGNLHYGGDGVEKCQDKANMYWEMAAKQGDIQSQYNLGESYYNAKNWQKAYHYWSMAAEQNHAESQAFLGGMYVYIPGSFEPYGQSLGLSESDSNKKARELWLKAAQQGNARAIRSLTILDRREGRTTPSFVPGRVGSSNAGSNSGSNAGGGEKKQKKIKPNAKCPCGSGKKYKKCCHKKKN